MSTSITGKRMVCDWEKVVESLISFLTADGIECYAADNGEDDEYTQSTDPKVLAEKCCECDQGWLKVRKDGVSINLWLVLGNAPSEIVSDWSYKSGEDHSWFEKSWEKFCEHWELAGDTCPMKYRE